MHLGTGIYSHSRSHTFEANNKECNMHKEEKLAFFRVIIDTV